MRLFRRFTAFCLVCCFSLALVFVAVPARALGGTDLMAASAILSFLSSAGVHLWRDFSGAYDEDVLAINFKGDMKQVWDDYTDYEPSAPSFDNLIDGISIHDGNWIYNYDTALTLQGFTDWLANRLDNKVGVPGELLGGFSEPGSDPTYTSSTGFVAYSYGMGQQIQINSTFTYIGPQIGTTFNGQQLYLGINDSPGSVIMSYYSSGNTYELYFAGATSNKVQPVTWSSSGGYSKPLYVSYVPSDKYPGFCVFTGSGVAYNVFSEYRTSVPLGNLTTSDLTSDGGSGGLVAGDLLGELASTVADQTFNLVKPKYDEQTGEVISPGQDLAISVGAATDADADDLIADALARYIAQTETGTIAEPIAHPVPIEGESIAYPQPVTEDIVVDGQSLTFSDLGPMLTSRFPFCIPWDLADLFNTLVVPAKPINTRIDIVPQAWRAKYHITGDTSFQLDLTTDNWILLRKIIAWGFLFGACGELILLTKSAIWTA